MENLVNFYNSLLSIKNEDKLDTIKKVVIRQKEELKKYTNSLEGFCIYLANQIEIELKNIGITVHYVDFNKLSNFNHVSLISEFLFNNELKRVLIDPSFEQFLKKDNRTLLKLNAWPSEKIGDENFVEELLLEGCVLLDDNKFNRYVNAFSNSTLVLNLDEYLLNNRMKKL